MSIYDEFYAYVKPNINAEYKPTNFNIQENNTTIPVDMHIHSKFSTDLEIEQIVKRCMEQGTEWASITDHNSFQAIKELRQSEKSKCHRTYFDYDGVKIFTGVEVSCIMHLSRTNNLKLHILCYGFDVDSDNILMEMLSLKDKDYTRARYYPLYYLSKQDQCYQTSLQEFKQFAQEQAIKEDFTGRIHLKDTVEFYEWKGIPKNKVINDLKGFDFTNPTRDSIKLDVVDVINATHASGGYCAIAHPTLNLERHWKLFNKHYDALKHFTLITNRLLEIGCDGVEIANRTDSLSTMFNKIYSDVFFRSCGTDTHYFGSNAHTDIGSFNIDMSNQNAVDKLLSLENAKNLGKPTKRQLQVSKIDNQNTYINFDYEKTR